MNDTTNSLAHTMWNCKYHIVFAPKYRRKVFYYEKRLEVGKITKKIAEYIRNQLKEEEIRQLSIDFDEDPFTGSK